MSSAEACVIAVRPGVPSVPRPLIPQQARASCIIGRFWDKYALEMLRQNKVTFIS